MDAMELRSLSLYVHIPFCKAKCAYCDFLSFGGCGHGEQKQYMEALGHEIRAYKDIAGDYRVDTIFIGGGTPSFVDAESILSLLDGIHDTFTVSETCEITIEGNPDSLSRDKLIAYKTAGINRLSIGLQSANDSLLKTIGRVHNYDQFVAAFQNARQAGFDNINVDIMSGLPGEDMDSYVRTLAKVAEFQPEHISAYSLIVEEGTPLAEHEALCAAIPPEELDRQMYARTKLLLGGSGYERYEISNYAKQGYQCRHNMTYWTGGEYLGVGLGASSFMRVFFGGEWKTIRFHGIEHMDEYVGRFLSVDGMREDEYTNLYYEMEEYSSFQENNFLDFVRDYYRDLYFCGRKDEMEEMMFLGLRMMQGVSKSEFMRRFHTEMSEVYGNVIAKYRERGLLCETDDRLFLTDKGIDVSNVVMAEFML